MYQLLRQGVWLHAPTVHSVQGGLCALQDPPAPRQDQVLQVHLGAGGFGEGRAEGGSSQGSQTSKDPRDIHRVGGPGPLLGETAGRVERKCCLSLEAGRTGPGPWPEDTGFPASGTD